MIISATQKTIYTLLRTAYTLGITATAQYVKAVEATIADGIVSEEVLAYVIAGVKGWPTNGTKPISYSAARRLFKEGKLTSKQAYAFQVVRAFENFLSRRCDRVKGQVLHLLTEKELADRQAAKKAKQQADKASKLGENVPVTEEELEVNQAQAQAILEAGDVPQGLLLDTAVLNAIRILHGFIKDETDNDVLNAFSKIETYVNGKLGVNPESAVQ